MKNTGDKSFEGEVKVSCVNAGKDKKEVFSERISVAVGVSDIIRVPFDFAATGAWVVDLSVGGFYRKSTSQAG